MLNYIYFFLFCVEIMAIEWHGKFCKEEDDRIFIFLSHIFLRNLEKKITKIRIYVSS